MLAKTGDIDLLDYHPIVNEYFELLKQKLLIYLQWPIPRKWLERRALCATCLPPKIAENHMDRFKNITKT